MRQGRFGLARSLGGRNIVDPRSAEQGGLGEGYGQKPHSTKLEDQIVEYADWAIRQFMQEARKQPWFENTIFVLLGDHGKLVGSPDCEIPQSYIFTPFSFF